MSKHTPGPWRVGRPGTVVCDTSIEQGPKGTADVTYYGGHLVCESVTKANAERIVACVNACEGLNPEMVSGLLRVLRQCLTIMREPEPRAVCVSAALRAAEAAIAKAEERNDEH